MKRRILLPSVMVLLSSALAGCGDKQPDCNSESFSKSVIDLIGDNLFRSYDETDVKFSDKEDFIRRNHLELRNIKETSADEKNQTKICNFDVSIQPVAPVTYRLELKNQSATAAIDSNGKEVISAATNLGYGMLDDAERVERGNPSKEQQEALDALKKQEKARQDKTDALKKEVLNFPAEKYQFVSEKDLTWLFLARVKNLDPKEMLNLVDGEYYNEQDEFKKRDMEKVAIPAMMEKIEQYKRIKFIKLVSASSKLDMKLDTISGAPVLETFVPGSFPDKYDFEKQVFRLSLGGCPETGDGGFSLTTRQNIKIRWDSETSLSSCTLKPKDETEARAWNEIFQEEQYQSGHNNYVALYLALNDNLDSSGSLDAILVRADVNYNGRQPLRLTTQ